MSGVIPLCRNSYLCLWARNTVKNTPWHSVHRHVSGYVFLFHLHGEDSPIPLSTCFIFIAPVPSTLLSNAVHCFSIQPYLPAQMCLPHPHNRPSYPHLAENEQVLSLRTGQGQRDIPFFPATKLYLKMSFPLWRSCALPCQLGFPQSNACLLLSLATS